MGFFSRLFGKPTRDDFAEDVIKQFRASSRSRVTYNRAEYSLTFPNDAKRFLNLENGYVEYSRASRGERRNIVARWARLAAGTGEQSTEFKDVKDNLLPRVRERSYYSVVRMHLAERGTPDPKMVNRPLGEFYTVGIAIDQPDSVTEPGGDTIKGWPVSLDEAYKIARENLWKRSNEEWIELRSGLYRSPWQDNHDASRLVLHDLIWQLKVQGNHVAVAPNRDTLLVTGRDDEQGLIALAKVARATMEEPRFMTSIPLELNGSEWTPLSLEESHSAHTAVQELYALSLGREYDEQKALLEALHAKNGTDIFVANYIVTKSKETGKFETFGSWKEGVHTYLPQTDYIFLGMDDGSSARVPWEKMMQHAPELLKQLPDLYPPRYEVTTFPSADQRSKMIVG